MDLPPVETLKTLLIADHPIGLASGVGGTPTLDIIAFRYFYLERITHEKRVLFHFIARLVTVGLTIPWITILAFLKLFLEPFKRLLIEPPCPPAHGENDSAPAGRSPSRAVPPQFSRPVSAVRAQRLLPALVR